MTHLGAQGDYPSGTLAVVGGYTATAVTAKSAHTATVVGAKKLVLFVVLCLMFDV